MMLHTPDSWLTRIELPLGTVKAHIFFRARALLHRRLRHQREDL